MKWWSDMRRCRRCGNEFAAVRQKQHYCSPACRVSDAVSRYRSRRSDYKVAGYRRSDGTGYSTGPRPPQPHPDALGGNPDGSTKGALQGDDYPLEYDADGNPILPECLRRRAS